MAGSCRATHECSRWLALKVPVYATSSTEPSVGTYSGSDSVQSEFDLYFSGDESESGSEFTDELSYVSASTDPTRPADAPKRLRSLVRDLRREICAEHWPACLSGVKDLLTRPWFCRVWIKQDFHAARDLRFLRGDR